MTAHPTPIARYAGILSADTQFRQFVAAQMGLQPMPDAPVTINAAAEYIRAWCKIGSRRDLDTNPAAAQAFRILQTEFDAWRGRIGRPERNGN